MTNAPGKSSASGKMLTLDAIDRPKPTPKAILNQKKESREKT